MDALGPALCSATVDRSRSSSPQYHFCCSDLLYACCPEHVTITITLSTCLWDINGIACSK